MNGKGDKRRPTNIPKCESDLRDALWRAPEEDKPALLSALVRLVEDRKQHGLYNGADDK
jgi:hypothetical protein